MSCLGDSSSSVTKVLRNLSWSRSPQGIAAVNVEVNAMCSAAAHMRTEFIPGHVLRSSHLLPQNSISTSENKHWQWEMDGSPVRGRTSYSGSGSVSHLQGTGDCWSLRSHRLHAPEGQQARGLSFIAFSVKQEEAAEWRNNLPS